MRLLIQIIISVFLMGCTLYSREQSLLVENDNSKVLKILSTGDAETRTIYIIDKNKPAIFNINASKTVNEKRRYDCVIKAIYTKGIWDISKNGTGVQKIDKRIDGLIVKFMDDDCLSFQFEIKFSSEDVMVDVK